MYEIERERFWDFIEHLKNTHEVIAPVKTDLVRFETIKNVKNVSLERSYFPAKEFFFRKQEIIFRFHKNKIKVPEPEDLKRAIFGLRRCDLNAIKHQDHIFQNDPYYSAQRERTILIGFHCDDPPSKHCFCNSLDLDKNFFDLMVYDRHCDFVIEVGSKKGKKLIDRYSKHFKASNQKIDKEIPGADYLNKKDLTKHYDSKDWKKGSDICLSCAACTNLCPTCYCFEVTDRIDTDNPEKGLRKRDWSSCQLKEFSRVAGDHIFRESREARFKHRIFHQLQYFFDDNGFDLCVGCGRCIEGCPTRIDFVKIINKL